MGYKLREGKTLPSPKLVKAIEDFPRPSTVKQVLSYLGTCNFFRNYIPRFAHTAAPLYDLTRKRKGNATIEDLWTPTHDTAFLDLKKALMSFPCLIQPDFSKEFYLHTDASGTALGAVLT